MKYKHIIFSNYLNEDVKNYLPDVWTNTNPALSTQIESYIFEVLKMDCVQVRVGHGKKMMKSIGFKQSGGTAIFVDDKVATMVGIKFVEEAGVVIKSIEEIKKSMDPA